MPLPERIRVKLSSEEGGAISLTRVVVQDLPLAELLDVLLAISGKDHHRIGDTLRRGSFVHRATRYRFDPLSFTPEELAASLKPYPDADPSRPCDFSRCEAIHLRGAVHRVEILRAAGAKPRFLRRRSFWDELLALASTLHPVYVDYSYPARADRFTAALDAAACERIRAGVALSPYPQLAAQVARAAFDRMEIYVARLPR